MSAKTALSENRPRGESGVAERTLTGTKINNYTIGRRIGQGGMGEVYEAVHTTPEKRAVVKVLSELRGSGKASADAQRRFHDEARALCQLSHPNLVQLYDWGELAEGVIYILMEYVDGPSLKAHLEAQGGKLPLPEAMEIARQIAEALTVVHRAGIVHRDLTPANILLSPDPTMPCGVRVKILDFGIAKFCHERDGCTQTGETFGTPRYMSPEQCDAASTVDDRADLYSLGLLIFEMLTGESPYQVPIPTPIKWMDAHVRQRPRALTQLLPRAPKHLVRLVTALLDKTAEQRPGAGAVAAFFSSGAVIRRSLRMPKTLVSIAAGIVATALAAGLGGWAWMHVSQKTPPTLTPAELAVIAAKAPSGMVLIPGGAFLMGSSRQQINAALAECGRLDPNGGCHGDIFERERGQHGVWLSPYYLSIHETTNAEFVDFLNRRVPHPKPDDKENPREIFFENAAGKKVLLVDLHSSEDGQGSQLRYANGVFSVKPGFERMPVVQVSQPGALEYCKNFHGWDLPTEAQWEFAAQDAGQTGQSLFPWGNNPPSCKQALLARTDSACPIRTSNGPSEVGTHPADRNYHGVFDLAGNVSEWTRDVFVDSYRPCGRCTDPVESGEPSPGSNQIIQRVFRGGSFALSIAAARAQSRSRRGETVVSPDIGFRCAAPAVKTQ